ncbi:MAG: sulfide/dihydroorotate dehydrogenase-like FAD/NAD-binding protein [Gammaproteobacteria bacterium]|nr:sulfide/dihydroorotate dehydrogenase-like FAD/NAD-binding protein [Gammaproteobacteria bacterium]
MAKILEIRSLTPVTKLYRVEAPLVAAAAKPGQFVIVRAREGGERIPLTIADYDRDAGTLTIVIQEVGATTRFIGSLSVGDDILDLVGPLGMAVEPPDSGHVVGIGGGFGAAALLCMMREFTARGLETTSIVGARNKDLLILTDELAAACNNVELCTDDGSAGHKGFVTERLAQLIDGDPPGRPDVVIAIGPMAMMRAVASTTEGTGIPTLVSMDPLMVDGTGMCGGCRVTVDNEVKFACVDGPLFDAHLVDFNEAMRRNKMYFRQEQQSKEREACVRRAAGQD